MLLPLENIRSLIFDFDLTLVESSKASIECISYAQRQMGLAISSSEAIRKTIGMSLEDALKELAKITDQESAAEFRRLFVRRADEVMLDNMFFLDGVKQVLLELDRRNLGLGIVSNKYRYRIEAFLARENFTHVIDTVVGFEDAPKPKPDPAGLLTAIEKLHSTPERTVYIGDSLVDAETASRVNLPFIAVLTGVTGREDFAGYANCRIIDSLKEIPGLLK